MNEWCWWTVFTVVDVTWVCPAQDEPRPPVLLYYFLLFFLMPVWLLFYSLVWFSLPLSHSYLSVLFLYSSSICLRVKNNPRTHILVKKKYEYNVAAVILPTYHQYEIKITQKVACRSYFTWFHLFFLLFFLLARYPCCSSLIGLISSFIQSFHL